MLATRLSVNTVLPLPGGENSCSIPLLLDPPSCFPLPPPLLADVALLMSRDLRCFSWPLADGGS